VPAPSKRLVFRPVQAAGELLDLMVGVLDGTLDAHGRDDLTRMSAREAATLHYEGEFARYTSPREWWQIASLPDGDPVGFVILRRDAAELHLTLVRGHRAGRHNVAHLMVADATALYQHLVSNGVQIIKGLRDADYGLRGFVLADPDGNRIDVGQRLPAPA
jgi:catechol 2,3-dioxygenase-like lactoylglutathione lyase family enzyme